MKNISNWITFWYNEVDYFMWDKQYHHRITESLHDKIEDIFNVWQAPLRQSTYGMVHHQLEKDLSNE
jgi:hypothetical protein